MKLTVSKSLNSWRSLSYILSMHCLRCWPGAVQGDWLTIVLPSRFPRSRVLVASGYSDWRLSDKVASLISEKYLYTKGSVSFWKHEMKYSSSYISAMIQSNLTSLWLSAARSSSCSMRATFGKSFRRVNFPQNKILTSNESLPSLISCWICVLRTLSSD